MAINSRMPTSVRRILTGVLLLLITVLVGSLGYMLAGWSPLDANYMVMITIFSVGYEEVHPLTTPGLKLYTMAVIPAGSAAVIYSIGGLVAWTTEGELRQVLGARRMTREIKTLRGPVIISGYGRLCRSLAQ